jgi:hypothetical protein
MRFHVLGVLLFSTIAAAGCTGYLDDFARTWGADGGVPGQEGDGGFDDPADDDPDGRDAGPSDPEDPGDDPPPQWDGGGEFDGGGGGGGGGLVAPGGACACDSDCEGAGGRVPLCIHGICGVESTDSSCAAGSTSGCPAGHRCWSGTGRGVCYPDYASVDCAGQRDGDGSCVTDGSFDCYRSCGSLCDLPGEPPGGDEPDDPVEPDDPAPDDPVEPDPVEPDTCEYPAGPYRLGQGNVIAPMSWPSARAGSSETGAADLADLRCESEVRAIFIDVGATWCSACSERMAEIASQRDVWERNGVQWIFIVSDASSAAEASSYVDRYGIDFGYRTNDADNSQGSGAVANSGLFSTIPWAATVRAADMLMVYDETSSYIDLAAVAAELSGS